MGSFALCAITRYKTGTSLNATLWRRNVPIVCHQSLAASVFEPHPAVPANFVISRLRVVFAETCLRRKKTSVSVKRTPVPLIDSNAA